MGDFGLNARTFEEALAEARVDAATAGHEANMLWRRAETESKQAGLRTEQMLSDYEAAARGVRGRWAPGRSGLACCATGDGR